MLTGYEILDDVHVGQRIYLGGFGGVRVDPAEAGEGVGTVDVHGARAADPLATRPPEGQRRIQLVLDLDQTVQQHRTARIQVHCGGGGSEKDRGRDATFVH